MGKKSKSKKRSKQKDTHGRKCKCDKCSKKRAGRKWNRKRVTFEREEAQYKKEKALVRSIPPGFLSGGHQKLKRDLSFERGESSEPISYLHARAKRHINKTFPGGKLKSPPATPYLRGLPTDPIRGYRIFRAYQIDSNIKEFLQQQGNITLLWHGTPAKNISSIGHDSLEVRGKYGLLGGGIYLAPKFLKAWRFTGHTQFPTVLVCAAKLGKMLHAKNCIDHVDDCGKLKANWSHVNFARCSKNCKRVSPSKERVQSRGYDTCVAHAGANVVAWGGYLLSTEHCVYDKERVVPLYAVTFSKGK